MEVAVESKDAVLIFASRNDPVSGHFCQSQLSSVTITLWKEKKKAESVKEFCQWSEHKECLSSETNCWNTEGQKQFISAHSTNEGILWLCCPLTRSISGKLLKTSYSPRPPIFLTWTETTYHTTNVCYFRHLEFYNSGLRSITDYLRFITSAFSTELQSDGDFN